MWLKQFRKKKLQSALIFLIITLCSLLITGSVIILTSLSSPYNELAEETRCANMKIYPSTPSEISGKDWISFVSETDGVESAAKIKKQTITSVYINGAKTDCFIDLCEYGDFYKDVRVLEGSLDDLADGTCALPSSIAYEHDVKLGDSILVPNGDTLTEYKVSAIFAEIYSMSTAFTSDVLVTSYGSEAVLGEVIAITYKDGITNEDFIAAYAEKNSGVLDGYFRSREDCITNAALTEKIMGGVLLGISVCILLVILLIISYIIKTSLRRDRRNIAVFKSMGYTERHIAGIYIKFYQSVVFLGSVVGALSSVIISLAFIRSAYKNLGVENTSADLWQKLLCVAVINLITFIILLREFRKLRRMKPVEILSGAEYGKKKTKERRGFISSFSPLAMALRMLWREKKRSAIIIVTCVVSVYIVNISVVCLENIHLLASENNYYWLGIDNHDVSIENIGSYEKFNEICDTLSADDKVSRLTKKSYGIQFSIPYHESVSATVMETYNGVEMDVLEGRNPQANNEIAIGNIYIKQLGVTIGDYIDICLDENTTVRMLIVGTYQGFFNMGKSIRILGSLLDEHGVYYQYGAASVMLTDGTDIEQFISDTESEYGSYITTTDRKNLYANVMEMICEPQRNALLPFVAITVIIGAVNLFYIIYSNNCDKRKKNTILRSVGFSASHIVKTNLIYVTIIALFSIAFAIPALIYLFPQVMILAMSGFGFAEYRLTVYPLTVVLINGGMFLLFMLVTLLSSRDLYKNHINTIVNE